jgi:peptide/nickel transport system substrate-binding protein
MFYPWPAPAVQHARTTKTVVIREVFRQSVLYWGLDKSRAPFNDVRVRQAFAYVVPRLQRQQVCWYGTGSVSFGNMVQSWNWAYTPIMTYKVSENEGMAKATTLLESAGWKMGPSGVRVSRSVAGLPDGTALRVNVPYEADWQQAQCNTELLQQTLKPLGVDIIPNKYDPATFWDDVAKNKFQMFHGGNGAPNVDDFMVNFLTTKGELTNIVSKWSNPEVDSLVADAVNSMDRQRAKADYARVEQIVATQLPMIVTGSQSGLVGTSPSLKGFESRPDNSNRSLIMASF